MSRVAVYLDNKISYIRRRDLEGVNSNLLILDLVGSNPVRLINVYRSFSPQHNINQREKFTIQLQLIKAAHTPTTIIMGDLNLDWNKKFDASCAYKNYFEDMELHLEESGLNQMLNQAT